MGRLECDNHLMRHHRSCAVPVGPSLLRAPAKCQGCVLVVAPGLGRYHMNMRPGVVVWFIPDDNLNILA